MRLNHLYLRNFRNYKEAHFTFQPGVNAIIGENGKGKTNLLEAIYFLITGKSFRTSSLQPLIHFEASFFYLEASFEKDGVGQVLKITCDGKERTIIHNSTPLTRLSALFGILLGVILTPDDHVLVTGSPSIRRRFLDLHIAQFSPHYLFHLSRYAKALKIRNELLKRKELANIEIWEKEMALSASHVVQERRKAVVDLGQRGQKLQLKLSGDKDFLSILYQTKAKGSREEIEKMLIDLMEKNREREVERGSSLVGPHRDDLGIFLAEKEAKIFGSEGQKRSCTAALRLSEWIRLKDLTGQIPLMCIDDVGISLDPLRERHLHEELGGLGQSFFTSPKNSHAFQNSHVINL
jgi:DNA replication and repair protein RecF